MPMKAPTLCREGGCGALAYEGGRCAHHTRAVQRAYDKQRGSQRARGYDRQWERFRRMVLTSNPLCVVCKAVGEITPARELDHIVPLARGGERLDPENVQALCKRHHSMKTAKEIGWGRGGRIEKG